MSALVAFMAGCRTTDEASVVRDLPPAATTILVAPVTEPMRVDGDPLHFTYGAAEFQAALVEGLRKVDAASRIVGPGDLRDDEFPDFELRVRFVDKVRLSEDGVSNFVASGGLWLVTWIGGLLVDDYAYRAQMPLECEIFSPRRGRGLSTRTSGGVVELSFFERNAFLSWPTAQSLILPPFWTTDEAATTSEAVSRAGVDEAAVELARYLKQDFERAASSNDGCGFVEISPPNGSQVSSREFRLDVVVRSRDPIDKAELRLEVDGVQQPIDAAEPERVDIEYRTRLTARIVGLDARPEHLLRIRVVADSEFTRTLRYRTGDARAD